MSGSEKILTQRSARGTAVIVLLGIILLSLWPLVFRDAPGAMIFFAVWYLGLAALGLRFVFHAVRNPKFLMRIQDARLIWHDGVNPQLSGEIDCRTIRCVRLETHPQGESDCTRVYLILLNGGKRELPQNCLPEPKALLKALKAVHPPIFLQDAT